LLAFDPRVEFTATPDEARLSGRHGNVEQERYLRELVPEHVVEKYRLGLVGLHLRERATKPFELRPGDRSVLGILTRNPVLVPDGEGAVDDLTFAAARPEGIQADVTRDGGSPRAQTAGACEGAPRDGAHDLFERRLDQVVVLDLAPTEDAIERVVDDVDQAIVELASNNPIPALQCLDQFFVRTRKRSLTGLSFE
jgi:hypothetical protein